MRVVAFVCMIACGAPAPAAPIANVGGDPREIGIDRVPALPIVIVAPFDRECQPSGVLRTRFASWVGESCGALGPKESQVAIAAATRCVHDALRERRPFVVLREHDDFCPGGSGVFAEGLIAERAGDELVMHEVRYSSDPCCGTCPQDGNTSLERCTTFDETCVSRDVTECFHCTGDLVASCKASRDGP